jgi:3-hydroxyacyl-CoA dehydrogenase
MLAPLGVPLVAVTAAASLPAIAEASGAGALLTGISFGSPAASGRLVELVAAPDTGPEARLAGLSLARTLGRLAIGTERAPIGPALWAAGRRAVEFMLTNGTPLGRVSAALSGFGLPPRLVAGMKEGPQEGILGEIDAAEIQDRVLTAMANAGAAAIAAGHVKRPVEVDLAVIHAQGFPRWRGGPMHLADHTGLFRTEQALLRYAVDGPEIWTPDPLFRDLVKNGRRLADLNAG